MAKFRFIEFTLQYSKTKGKDDYAIGEAVIADDPVFAGGRQWWVICHPRGINAELSDNGAYLSLCAMTRGPPKSQNVVKVIFDAVVVRSDGAPRPPSWQANRSPEQEVTCTPDGADPVVAGLYRFMRRSDLESSEYLVDGFVTFKCGVSVLHDGERLPVPSSDLGSHLGHLLDSGDCSDVSFSVAGETFRAHRAVLAARSPVFKALLLGPMADATMPTVTLHDIEPEAFRVLLRFVYTDALLMPVDNELEVEGSSLAAELLQHVLAAAEMYQLDRLKLVCAQKLWEVVSVDNVAAVLGCAEMHNCTELKKRCIDFLAVRENFKQSFPPSSINEIKARLIDEIRASVQSRR
ncbi:unnamed protein product [Urochloa decumbens]|uniref:BTB domain-containing protein n=1 Tax=Urochloa decumbens TaxID=240449 RepID=A0ABC9BQZ8_9POAL